MPAGAELELLPNDDVDGNASTVSSIQRGRHFNFTYLEESAVFSAAVGVHSARLLHVDPTAR